MNRYAIVTLLASAALNSSAMAYERFYPGWNVGVEIGQTTASIVDGNQDFDYSTMGFFGGYQFTPVLGVQGSAIFAINDVKDRFASNELDADVSNEFSSVGLYVTAQTPGDFFARGRVGIAESRFMYTAPGYADEMGSNFGLAYGFGGGVKLQSIVLGLDYLQLPEVDDPLFTDDSYKLSSLTASLTFMF